MIQINKKSPLPLYVQVSQILKKRLENQRYQDGSFLPSEFDLAKEYGVSRHTIRKSMHYLEERNIVVRIQGKGTQLNQNSNLKVVTNLSSWHSLHGEIKRETLPLRLHKLIITEEALSLETASLFGVETGTKAVTIERIFGIKKPSVYFKSYLNPQLNFSEASLKQHKEQLHLYEYLENFIQKKIIRSQERIEAYVASPEISLILELDSSEVIISRRRIAYLADQTPVEFNLGFYLAKEFRFDLDILAQ